MAGGEGAKPILSIEIDDSSWQSFLQSYADYKAQADKSGDEWAKFNSGVRQAKTAFDDLDESAEHLTDSLSSPKTTKGFVSLDKSSKETAKSWVSISKTIDKSSRDMANLLRDGGKFSGLMGFLGLGAVGVGASALFGAVKGANTSLADQNIANRKLGLKPGEEQAFDNVYERAGGNSALLGNVASAQADPQQWPALQAAGLSQQDIQGLDAAELSARLLQNVGQHVRDNGLQQTGLWSHAMGVDRFVDNNSMRLAGTYADQFGDMHQQYQQAIPGFAQKQKDLDEATAAHQQIKQALTQTEVEFQKALIKLNPEVLKLTGAVTDTIKAFSDSGDLDKSIKATENAFEDIAKSAEWVADKLNDLFGLKGKTGDTPLYSADAGSVGANVVQSAKNVWNYIHGLPTDDGPSKAVQWSPFSNDNGNGNIGSGATPKNNPGNLKDPKDLSKFQQFDTPDAGALAMDRQLMLYAKRDHLTSLAQVIAKYAPASENNTAAYIKDVSARTGFGATDNLNWDDPRVRAAVESAMIVHENGPGKYAQLDRQHIEALLTGKTSPFADPMAVKNAKATDKLSGFDVVPYTDDDARAKADDQQSFTDTLKQRMAAAGKVVSDAFADGAGSRFRSPDQQPTTSRASNSQQAPVALNVTTSSPPGWSTTVTAGTLAN
jgi:hypothetical protein